MPGYAPLRFRSSQVRALRRIGDHLQRRQLPVGPAVVSVSGGSLSTTAQPGLPNETRRRLVRGVFDGAVGGAAWPGKHAGQCDLADTLAGTGELDDVPSDPSTPLEPKIVDSAGQHLGSPVAELRNGPDQRRGDLRAVGCIGQPARRRRERLERDQTGSTNDHPRHLGSRVPGRSRRPPWRRRFAATTRRMSARRPWLGERAGDDGGTCRLVAEPAASTRPAIDC